MRHWTIIREEGGIATLVLDQADASTNTLSAEVMAELNEVLDTLDRELPQGLIIRSGKPNGFIAGADIDEFGQIHTEAEAIALVERGWNTFNRLSRVTYPTVVLIRGFCLGGGLELALACRYRVAVDEPETRLGLPEVLLGIVPAWGGIARLPKLIGSPAALDLLLTGKTVDARRAKKLGIVDEAVPERIMEHTVRGMLRSKPKTRRRSLMQTLSLHPLARKAIARRAQAEVAKRARREHYPAPYAILDLWLRYDGNALAAPPSDASSIPALLRSPTTANLLRVFRLQERLKGIGRTEGARVGHVHVVGAGTMGGDIAAWCALRGLTVTLQDQAPEQLSPAFGRAAKLFEQRLRDPRRIRDARDRLVPDIAGDGVSRADVIIEAIFENLEAKRALFATIERKARPDAILATNTSSIPLEDIASGMSDPARLLGLHFFNPVARMMLVEIVVGRDTRPSLLGPAAAFVRQIDKLPLPVRSAPGFLVNRILAPYMMAAMRAVDEGIAPETVDEAALAFGMPMGPIELADTVGLDITIAVGKLIGRGQVPPRKLAELVASGHLGRKSGRGFYAWRDGKPAKQAAGAVPQGLTDRLIDPLVSEARAALAEGIVTDADLVDAGAIFGTGFAPFRGGPLHYAQTRESPPIEPASPAPVVV